MILISWCGVGCSKLRSQYGLDLQVVLSWACGSGGRLSWEDFISVLPLEKWRDGKKPPTNGEGGALTKQVCFALIYGSVFASPYGHRSPAPVPRSPGRARSRRAPEAGAAPGAWPRRVPHRNEPSLTPGCFSLTSSAGNCSCCTSRKIRAAPR